MQGALPHYAITHAHQGAEPASRSAVRYLRFLRQVTPERLELSPLVAGRWAPSVPTHPAHLLVSTLEGGAWRLLQKADIAPDRRIAGDGLTQAMELEALEAHFRAVMAAVPVHVVPLAGVPATTLKVECDREHPVWPSHGECNGNPAGVPFGILDSLKVFGSAPDSSLPAPPWNPLLTREECAPRASRGMRVRADGAKVLFEGARLSVGFSLRRPVLLHLGWDSGGSSARAGSNRLSTRRVGFRDQIRGVSGPLLVGFQGDYGSHRWSGSVSVRGNQVFYRGLWAIRGLTLDARFIVEPDRLLVELTQSADSIPVIESEAWRFAFAATRGMTGVAGVPAGMPGRAGDVPFPVCLAGDGNGALSIRVVGGTAGGTAGATPGATVSARMQVESYRATGEVTAGIVLCDRPASGVPLSVPAGSRTAELEITVTAFEPASRRNAPEPGPGLRAHWSSVFSFFRPELGGFSNNALSIHCNQNQHTPIDVAVFTRRPDNGPDPIDCARFTIGRALAGGGGYGYWRSLSLDSDPVLVSSAGRIHQARPDSAWLSSISPGLTAAAALLLDRGNLALAGRCREAAGLIRSGYARAFLNPLTGWVACWTSRDGLLHDYASPLVNGAACAFGLLDHAEARRALEGLERLRTERGLESAAAGIPFTLLPIDLLDHALPAVTGGGATEPTFECYTDGSLSAAAAAFYLRALSLHGLSRQASRMCAELDRSLADGVFTGPPGGIGDGREFHTWEGLTAGYEGTFGLTFGVLYAMAIEQGLFTPPTPEWWPSNG